LKRIKILSGLAIGLSLIGWSQWLYKDTSEQAQRLAHSKPIQILIEKNTAQITKDFYPELDAPYEVFLISLLPENNHQSGKASVLIKIAKAEVFRDDKKIDIFNSNMPCSDRYRLCNIARFKSVANRKHTIVVNIENIDPKLYDLNPRIEISIPQMHRTKGLQNNFLKILAIGLLGIVILLMLILGLIQELIAKIYRQLK
jgi:hypothetical protein